MYCFLIVLFLPPTKDFLFHPHQRSSSSSNHQIHLPNRPRSANIQTALQLNQSIQFFSLLKSMTAPPPPRVCKQAQGVQNADLIAPIMLCTLNTFPFLFFQPWILRELFTCAVQSEPPVSISLLQSSVYREIRRARLGWDTSGRLDSRHVFPTMRGCRLELRAFRMMCKVGYRQVCKEVREEESDTCLSLKLQVIMMMFIYVSSEVGGSF